MVRGLGFRVEGASAEPPPDPHPPSALPRGPRNRAIKHAARFDAFPKPLKF